MGQIIDRRRQNRMGYKDVASVGNPLMTRRRAFLAFTFVLALAIHPVLAIAQTSPIEAKDVAIAALKVQEMVDSHPAQLTSSRIINGGGDAPPRLGVYGKAEGQALVPSTIQVGGNTLVVTFQVRSFSKSDWQSVSDELFGSVVDTKLPGGLTRMLPSGQPQGPGRIVATILKRRGVTLTMETVQPWVDAVNVNVLTVSGNTVSGQSLRQLEHEFVRKAPTIGGAAKIQWGKNLQLTSLRTVKK